MKKSRTSLFRVLILSLVMLVTVFIIVIAWFSSLTEATASGLRVKASPGSGLEASFTNDENSVWAYNIADNTAKAYPLVTGRGLFSGGNIDLFVPTVNRSTGEVETVTNAESQKVWGVSRTAVAGQDFFETDVYFRSTEKLDVAITDESSVTPRSLIKDDDNSFKYDTNLSEFGNFSRDYIAGAARVGFYDAQDNLKFVWAPNENYQLKAGSEFVEIKKNSAAGGGILSNNPEVTFNIDKLPNAPANSKDYYYIWEAKTVNTGNNQNIPLDPEENKLNPQGITMRYEESTGLYLAAFDVSSTTDVDHAIYPVAVDHTYNNGKQMSAEYAYLRPSFPTTDFAGSRNGNYNDRKKYPKDYILDGYTFETIDVFFENNKNITSPGQTSSKEWAKMTINAWSNELSEESKSKFFGSMDRFQVLIEYNPTTQVLKVRDFAFYNSITGGYGGGTIGTGEIGTSAFALKADQQVVFASPNNDPAHQSTFALNASSTGLSVNEVLLNATTVTEKDSDGNTSTRDTYKINQQSLLPGSVFTVEVSSAGQYKFKNNATGLYLYDNNGTLGLAQSAYATPFQLTNGSDYDVIDENGNVVTNSDGTNKQLTFCRLESVIDGNCTGRYLSISETGAFLSSQLVDCRIFINQGEASTSSSYTFKASGTAQDKYEYLIQNTKQIGSLTKVKEVVDDWVNLTPANNIVTNLSHVSGLSLVTLEKDKTTDEYYTGKIKIRIWVEGTDREAKTPLVNGVFFTQLVFNGTKVSA